MRCVRHFSGFGNVLVGVSFRNASASHRAVKSGDRGGQCASPYTRDAQTHVLFVRLAADVKRDVIASC